MYYSPYTWKKDDQSQYRNRTENEQLSFDLKKEVLEKCGFPVAVEKRWNTSTL